MNKIIDYKLFAEFILEDKQNTSADLRNQLIRILRRSSTLPKVEDIYIRTLKADPYGFFIVPGVSVVIGTAYLANPVAALLCLRYGLEWQIWYKNQTVERPDTRICDLAACRVTAKFHNLTPGIDKESINEIPEVMAENILRFSTEDDVHTVMEEIDFSELSQFHSGEIVEGKIKENYLQMINYLAYPIEYLMTLGGDFRLKVDPDELLNKYGCRPFPRPEAFTFASSTASSISNTAYNRAQFKRKNLIRQSLKEGFEQTFADFTREIKDGLKENFHLPKGTQILLSSSGTDVSLLIAGICQVLCKRDIVHIIVAADETGSGVPLALRGCHFNDSTALGRRVAKGKRIDGFRKVEIVDILLRDGEGVLKDKAELNAEVMAAVEEAVSSDKQPILHAIDQSKLGYTAPEEDVLLKVKEKYGEEVPVLVDNSQLRMDPDDIRHYMEQGFLMTITGSKFFTGPPFNGALLIPESFKKKEEELDAALPIGLTDYFHKEDIPYPILTANLESGMNFGRNMRWYASLVEIERYYNTPLSLRYLGVEMFCEHVHKAIEEADYLEHISGSTLVDVNDYDPLRMKHHKTIYPFFIKKDGVVLSLEKLKELYQLLNKDILDLVDADASDEIKRVAAQACHIGQPVAAKYSDGTDSGVVRINLGSRVISESWKNRDSSIFFTTIEEQMIQVDIILKKIQLILGVMG